MTNTVMFTTHFTQNAVFEINQMDAIQQSAPSFDHSRNLEYQEFSIIVSVYFAAVNTDNREVCCKTLMRGSQTFDNTTPKNNRNIHGSPSSPCSLPAKSAHGCTYQAVR
jgi:hypothetical protein